jgi:hypothetical protein
VGKTRPEKFFHLSADDAMGQTEQGTEKGTEKEMPESYSSILKKEHEKKEGEWEFFILL